MHVTHHPVAVCDIFVFTVNIEGDNTKNSNFIRNFMNGTMDQLDPR